MNPNTPRANLPESTPPEVVIAGLDQNVASEARAVAERRINERLERQDDEGRLRHMIRRVWTGNIAREYYRQKEIHRASGQIATSGNLYSQHNEAMSDEDWQEAASWVARRMLNEHGLREGETLSAEEDKDSGIYKGVTEIISDLSAKVIKGEFDDPKSLREEKKRKFAELIKAQSDELREKAKSESLYADNILEVVENIRQKAEHDESMKDVDEFVAAQMEQLKLRFGQAKVGVSTEIGTKTDRFIEWFGKRKAFRWLTGVNESSLGLAAAAALTVAAAPRLAISAARTAAQWTIGLNLPVRALISAGIGVSAGAREFRQVKKDRRFIIRERAEGQNIGEVDNKRRREIIDKALYDDVKASALLESIAADKDGEIRIKESRGFYVRLRKTAEIRARIEGSDEKQLDLISFSSVKDAEHERFELIVAAAESKAALRKYFTGLDDKARKKLLDRVIVPESDDPDKVFDQLFGSQQETFAKAMEEQLTSSNKAANRLALKMARNTALITAGTSLATSYAVQLASGWAFGHAAPSNLETSHLGGFNGGTIETTDTLSSHISFGPNVDVLPAPNGAVHILTSDGHVIMENVPINPDGSMGQEAINQLQVAGVHVDSLTSVTPVETIQPTHVNANELVANHSDTMTHVSRAGWDIGPNEQRLDMSYDAASDTYTYSINRMSGVNADDMQMALSASRGTQSQAFMVDFVDGKAAITPDNPAHALFSEGHFNGGYAEAAHVNGDSIIPVATELGKNTNLFTDSVHVLTDTPTTSYSLTYDIPAEMTQPAGSAGFAAALPLVPRGGVGVSQPNAAANRGADGSNKIETVGNENAVTSEEKPKPTAGGASTEGAKTKEKAKSTETAAKQPDETKVKRPKPSAGDPAPEKTANAPEAAKQDPEQAPKVDSQPTPKPKETYVDRHPDLPDETKSRLSSLEDRLRDSGEVLFTDISTAGAQRYSVRASLNGNGYVARRVDSDGRPLSGKRNRRPITFHSMDDLLDKFVDERYITDDVRSSVIGRAINRLPSENNAEFTIDLDAADNRIADVLGRGNGTPVTPTDRFRVLRGESQGGVVVRRVRDGRKFTLPFDAVLRTQSGTFLRARNASETAATTSIGQQATPSFTSPSSIGFLMGGTDDSASIVVSAAGIVDIMKVRQRRNR